MPYQTVPTTYETIHDILASSLYVASTYTIDRAYVTPITLADGTTRKVLPEGTVVAYSPVSGKAVPNYTAYGFTALGVLLQQVDVGVADEVGAVIHRGDLTESLCSDNGVFGTVLSATKTALADRIHFVSPANRL